ncbi:MAG TPA: PepSY-associated TM helix domain-containing protein, partial [Bacteroidia bacterium]|nr:PepSY-associated TM helix domain-containing protein [Bacteroidia bacterium]
MKKIVNKIHLILGLIIGVIIIVVSLTGCIYAFQAEIQKLTQSYRFVDEQQAAFLPPSQLKEIAIKELQGKAPNSIHYGKKNQSAVISFYGSKPDYFYQVYLNPYTGSVLKVKDMNS